MNNIIWLASYPKSGNTWLRIFLSNYFHGSEDINDIHTDNIASARFYYEDFTGIDSQYLSHAEQFKARSASYIHRSNNSEKELWVKVHDSFQYRDDCYLFPKAATKAAIYIVRNPMDVSISYANHNNLSIEDSVKSLLTPGHTIAKSIKTYASQLPQIMGTWADHYNSWTKQEELPVHIVRYEELKQDPVKGFGSILEFLGIDIDHERLLKSIENSSFDKLSSQEKEKGFNEKPTKAKSFFRKGIVGDYKNKLTEEQIESLSKAFTKEMQELDYMDNKGEILI